LFHFFVNRIASNHMLSRTTQQLTTSANPGAFFSGHVISTAFCGAGCCRNRVL